MSKNIIFMKTLNLLPVPNKLISASVAQTVKKYYNYLIYLPVFHLICFSELPVSQWAAFKINPTCQLQATRKLPCARPFHHLTSEIFELY